jgi:tight adherence protein B
MMLALFFVFCATLLFVYFTVPMLYEKTMELSQKRASSLSSKIDRVLPRRQVQKITQFYILAPVIFGGVLYVVMPEQLRFLGIFLGVIGGIIFPGIYNKILIAQNHKKFDDQLIDALLIMSSSFRGGLSLVQAMEAVVEEMPDPINQEFSIVLGENNMGVSLDEALAHLYNRQPSSAVQQTITSILLARETGGNLPAIFQRIVGVIRETKRIRGQIETLTIQGKIQGVVMSLLPVAFFSVIYGANPQFFDHMLKSQMGRILLIYALISEIVGAVMIWKISAFKDF